MNIGDLSITNFYVGDIQADKICLGAEQVWPNTPPGPDYASMYLTVEIISGDTLEISNSGISYSVNDGPWIQVPSTTSARTGYLLSVSVGDKIRFKGNQATQNAFYRYSRSANCIYDVYGNILSLEYGDNFIGQTQFLTTYRPCYGTFRNQTDYHLNAGARSAEHLILPPTVVEGCYRSMFQNSNSLIKAPVLPATTLATGCYFNMFGGCTGLTDAPELPATALANECYYEMFKACTSLTTAPELPVTTLMSSCYTYMFSGCSSLITAPELPAETLVSNCYMGMFGGCSSLNYIKCLATNPSSQTGSANPYTFRWVVDAGDGTGTFVKHPDATWPSGDNGIPEGWTVVDA